MKLESIAILLVSRHAPTVAWYLTGQGLRVTSVADTAAAGRVEALALAYDCIVLDREDPRATAAFVRAVRATSELPILIIASTRGVDERVDALDAGADDCIPPPLGHRELLLRITATVRRSRGLRSKE